jgi:hypothetical protein
MSIKRFPGSLTPSLLAGADVLPPLYKGFMLKYKTHVQNIRGSFEMSEHKIFTRDFTFCFLAQFSSQFGWEDFGSQY